MIFETIVTTVDGRGTPHLAPMGILRPEDGCIILAPFRPSTTLDNVLHGGWAVVNYSDDVRVFAGCLTGRRAWPTVAARRVPCVRLETTLAHSELELDRLEDHALRPRLICRVVHEQIHAPFRGFNRAQAAVLEAAILVSRLDRLPWQKIEHELGYLAIAVEKTAGAAEREAWEWLMERVDAHRVKLNGENAV